MNNFRVISWEELACGNECFFSEDTAVTIGGFDGPHRGHNELFNIVLKKANKTGLKPGIITFFVPPAAVKNSEYSGNVSTLRLRLKKFSESGFQFIILIDFSASFAKIDGTAFFDILVKTIRLKYLAVGDDFYCGYRRGLGVESLKKLAPQMGFCFDSIRSVSTNDGFRVSSTSIREAVTKGDFTLAKDLLGYPFLFDIVGPSWSVTDKNSITVQRSFLTQILPPCGKYKVFLTSFKGIKKEAFLKIDEAQVELVFTQNKEISFNMEDLNNFDTVEFICKE